MNHPESKRFFPLDLPANFFGPWFCGSNLLRRRLHGFATQNTFYRWRFRLDCPGGPGALASGKQYPELAGEIVMAKRADGACSIQFTKTLLPVMLAQTTSNQWLIQFPPRQLGFAGRGKPPRRFSWLYLSAALAGEKLPDNFNFARHPGGGWRLENSRTGETLDGFLGP